MKMSDVPLDDRGDMEQRMTRALERIPEVAIPEGFAARVAAEANARGPRIRVPLHEDVQSTRSFDSGLPVRSYGEMAGLIAAALLAVCMLAVAEHASPGTSLYIVELFLTANFAGLTVWMTVRHRSY